MDPLDFLGVAERLCLSASEAERRTSIGRSYYALYNLLLASLSSQGVHFENAPGDHARLVYYLLSCADREAALIGAAVRDLRGKRNNADYKMGITVEINDSEFAHKKAARAIDRFRQLTDLANIVQLIKTLGGYQPPRRR